ncbi:hypothetical protein FCU45_06050 [Sulfurimonas crateris]|uniref:Nitrous oxide reductase accessory protein NosL n=1 Tax=Sulfurimonas crateris TaxID=2574727 RepID=A0A4U2Z5W7_9BACT|nr:hypothetical protein [Sulfurimonas crateris]TKI69617.1 hypothetical protein FCU45_06050 [Sulfurimonas crateris]
MKDSKVSFFILNFLLLFFISGCNSSGSLSSKDNKEKQKEVCPKCNMELPSSNIYTAKLQSQNKSYGFDDIGCLVLWSQEKNISMYKAEVFTNDTQKYIDASKAYFSFNEKTPMSYGFGAYEIEKENTVKIDEVKLRILRGEHMGNPKIRKQILGY